MPSKKAAAAPKKKAAAPKVTPVHVHLTKKGKVKCTPVHPTFQKDDLVEFIPDEGVKLFVKLKDRTAYTPSSFKPGSAPLKVMKGPTGERHHADCGFIFELNGATVAIGKIPKADLPPGVKVSPYPHAGEGFDTDP